jgi:hypothetical protein
VRWGPLLASRLVLLLAIKVVLPPINCRSIANAKQESCCVMHWVVSLQSLQQLRCLLQLLVLLDDQAQC